MGQTNLFYLISCLLKVVRLVYIMVKEAIKELESCEESFIVKVIFDKQKYCSCQYIFGDNCTVCFVL